MGIGASDLVAPWPGSIPLEAVTDEHLDSSLVVMPYYPNIESLVVILVEPLHSMGLVQRTVEPPRLVAHDHLVWLPLDGNIQPGLGWGIAQLVIGHHTG